MLKYTSDNQNITDARISGENILEKLKGMDTELYEFFKQYDYTEEEKEVYKLNNDFIKLIKSYEIDEEGGIEALQEILADKRIDINYEDEYGWTALMNASYKGKLEIVKLLKAKELKNKEK